ncbi:DUF1254 domain-containing protein [Nitrosococcus watsonii]|uniref:DUF1254 domain-containing protein n=1 Tax=Nitrosococcus watsoni (strain C-113) TaxID=105559 RepID=D8K8S0_NITWC|nr:DUF1254 domain-containing protein [Nitrosococcus watsonii]ADJ27130.1 protein of unknown function DUF1254 [Nitrosococcus watsonii C-113]
MMMQLFAQSRITRLACGLSLLCTATFGSNIVYAQSATKPATTERNMSPEQVKSLARDAYLYAYPLVLMDITMHQATNVPDAASVAMRAPVNQFAHFREYPDANTKDVVRFNFDTLYSFAWLDVSKEPMVISLPDMHGRYYLMPMLDMWTDVFAVPGTRTTGDKAGNYAIAAADWSGKLPPGVELIHAPTPIVWVMGRTQTNGPSDLDHVRKVQDAYKLTPLSQWGKNYTPPEQSPVDTSIDNTTPPLVQVNRMSGVELLTRLARLLKTFPPHASDYPILHRMAAVGFKPGQDFNADKLSSEVIKNINTAAVEAKTELQGLVAKGKLGVTKNGWNYATNLGNYGTDYQLRAMVAMAGLGANLGKDAIYLNAFADADGNPTTGEHDYAIHFDNGKLPPANAFWSLTMYDMDGFQVPNPINRFAIGDRDELKFNNDGSLDIYIQHQSPGKDKESNWLPAPEGPFQVMLRMYSPKASVFKTGLDLPPITKVP